jgi:hypothetical protein
MAATLAREGYRAVYPNLIKRSRGGRLCDPDGYALPE